MRHTFITSIIAASAVSLAGCGEGDSKPEAPVPSADSAPSTTVPSADSTPATTPKPAEDSGSTPASDTGGAGVTSAQKDTMESYVGTLEQLVDQAKGVTNEINAAASSPKIKGLLDQLDGYAQQFEEYSPETMGALREMYDDGLSAAKGRLDTELVRLRENDSFKSIADLLGQIKMP